MKSGWGTKKLGEVCETFNGIWKGSKPPLRNVGVIRSTNFTKECGFDSRDEKTVFIDVEEKKFLKRKLQCGDIVVERSGGGPNQPVGRVLYFNLKDGDYTISNFTSALRVKDNGELDSYYLYRALCALYFSGVTAKMQGNSINIINLHFDEYLNLDIPIPPLSEQKRIVKKIDAAFDKIDALKANAEKNLANAKELFQSALDEAMRPKKGWVEKRLGEVGEYRKGPFGSSLTKRMFVPKGPTTIKVYEQKNAIRKSATLGEYYITRDYFNEKMRGFEVLPGDVIVSCAGTIGETFIMPENMEQGIINQALMRMRISALIDKSYFLYYFDHILKKSANDLSNGSAMKNIPPFSVFKQLIIPVTTLAEQQEIVKRLDFLSEKVKLLGHNYTQQIADCAEMRQAILREAFEGRL